MTLNNSFDHLESRVSSLEIQDTYIYCIGLRNRRDDTYKATCETTWHYANEAITVNSSFHITKVFQSYCLKPVSTHLENQNQSVLKYSRILLKDFSQFPED